MDLEHLLCLVPERRGPQVARQIEVNDLGEHRGRADHVTERLPARLRSAFEWFCLSAALALTLYIAWYAVRSVWISYITHDISPAADASPLWIPQISMAMGCIGFALSFAHALVLRFQGVAFMAVSESARSE